METSAEYLSHILDCNWQEAYGLIARATVQRRPDDGGHDSARPITKCGVQLRIGAEPFVCYKFAGHNGQHDWADLISHR